MKTKTQIRWAFMLCLLFVSAASAQLSNRWEFLDSLNYVNDPDVLTVNETLPGYAELVLQSTSVPHTTFTNYFAEGASNSLVSIGADVSLRLAGIPGFYDSGGAYESRPIAGAFGNQWRHLVARGSKPIILNSPQELSGNMANIVGLWHFNNDWLDATPNENHGTAGTAGFSSVAVFGSHSGTFGGAYRQMPGASTSNGGEFTISCWVRSIQVELTLEYYPWGFVNGSANDYALMLRVGGTHTTGPDYPARAIIFRSLNQGYAASAEGTFSDTVDKNVWRHIVVVYDWMASQRTQIYKDGEKLTMVGDGIVGLIDTHDSLVVGARKPGDRWVFAGQLDEFAIFDRAMEKNEIVDLYNISSAIRLQLRSASDPSLLSGDFVGSDGTVNTFFYGSGKRTLESSPGGNFSIADPYVQYKLYLAPDADRIYTPFVESVELIGSKGTEADTTFGDFVQGTFDSGTTYTPDWTDWTYLGTAKKDGGGYYEEGTYESRVFSNETAVTWDEISWSIGGQLPNTISGILGLWRSAGWADVSGKGHDGTPVNVSEYAYAKLGTDSSIFNGVNSRVDIEMDSLIKTLEFWIRNENPENPIVAFEIAGGTNVAVLGILNGALRVTGMEGLLPSFYVNGVEGVSALASGWNHVALTVAGGIDCSTMTVGMVGIDAMSGVIDEMAAFDRVLSRAEVNEHYVSGRRPVAGLAKFQVRAANEPTFHNVSFAGPQGLTTSFYEDPSGVELDGVSGRYFQYKAFLEGDGRSTPAVGGVWVDYDIWQQRAGDTNGVDVHQGTFVDGATAWYGQPIVKQLLPSASRLEVDKNDVTLSGLWHLDESSWPAGETVKDSAGVRNGVANNAEPDPGSAVGLNCGVFSGSDSYISLKPLTDLTSGDFTVSVWVKTSAGNAASIMSTDAGGAYFALVINSDGTTNPAPGRVGFVIDDDSHGERRITSVRNDLSAGVWHHVCGIRKGTQIHLYIDGVRDATLAIESDYGSVGTGTPYLAKDGINDVFFTGYLDEVAVFARAVADGEVRELASTGYRTTGEGLYLGPVIDAERPSIWQSLSWVSDGPYGVPPGGTDTDVGGLWHLDDLGATAVDSSTYGNDGAIVDGTSDSDGVFSNCVSFNGSSSVVTVPDDSNLDEFSAFTIEAWAFPTDVANGGVLAKRTVGQGYSLTTDALGVPVFWLSGTPCPGVLPLIVNEWSHVAGVFDGSRMSLYVNGRVVGRTVPLGTTINTISPLVIGADLIAGAYFTGRIDEASVHKRALNSEEVLDHYRAKVGVLRFQAKSGNELPIPMDFVGPDGTSGSYFTALAGVDLDRATIPLGRYFQYKSYVDTYDSQLCPNLSGMKVLVSSYPSDGPTIEPVESEGVDFLGELLSFEAERSALDNTDVRYQLSGDAGTSNRWFYWGGSSWEQSVFSDPLTVYNGETTDMTNVNDHIGRFYDDIYAKTGGLFRFRAFLKSGGDQQVQLDWVDVTASPGRLVVLTPNGTENGDAAWISGVDYDVAWSWAGAVGANVTLEYSLFGTNGPWLNIDSGVSRGGTNGLASYTWTLPELAGLEYTNCYVRVRDPLDDTIVDISDGAFSILQKFRVIQPNGGEIWYVGQTNNLIWESAFNLAAVVEIKMAPDGSNYTHIVEEAYDLNVNGTSNVYPWVVPAYAPALLSSNVKMRVTKPFPLTLPPTADESDESFTIAGISITRPNGNTRASKGDPYNIEWTSWNAGDYVAIDLSVDGGTNYTSLTPGVINTNGQNSFEWIVAAEGTDVAMVRITSLTDSNAVAYTPFFTVASIGITSPTNDAVWLRHSTQEITWESGGAGSFVDIYYSVNDGITWGEVDTDVPNNHSHIWTLPEFVSREARVRVVSRADTNLQAVSERFNMAGVRVTYPNSPAHVLERGALGFVDHDAAPEAWGNARVEFSYDDEVSWNIIAETWNAGDPLLFRPTYPTIRARGRVTLKDPDPYTNIFDVSDVDCVVAGVLVTSPTTNDLYNIDGTEVVQWVSAGAGTKAQIFYSNEGTNNYVSITPGEIGNREIYPGNNNYDWDISRRLIPSADARIQVIAGDYSHTSPQFTVRGIRVTHPSDDNVSVWDIGDSEYVRWATAGIDSSARGTVSLSLDGGQSYMSDLLTNFALVDTTLTSWEIDPSIEPTVNAMLRFTIESSNNPDDETVEAVSDIFTLRGLLVVDPAEGDSWQLGDTEDISFISAGQGPLASISYSSDGGATWDDSPVAEDVPVIDGDNTVSWDIETDRKPSTNAVLRVQIDDKIAYSPAFRLGGIRVDRPLAYDIWAVGQVNPIRWVGVGTSGSYDIKLVYEDTSTFTIINGYGGDSLDWSVLLAAVKGQDQVTNVVLVVEEAGGGVDGESAKFKIVKTARIEIESPQQGNYWKVGRDEEIVWLKGGDMNAGDFRVVYWPESDPANFKEINDIVTYHEENNTFTIPWNVPDELGPTRIAVRNEISPGLADTTEVFYVTAQFRITEPNGNPTDPAIHSLEPIVVEWGTVGSATNVYLFYRYGTVGWTPINSTPMVSKGKGKTELYTSTNWVVPNVQASDMMFRVQDANYSEVFDGTEPGPYDDSDNPFSVSYYTIQWDVGYIATNNGLPERKAMDNLTVSDSSGWSESSLSCLDFNKNQTNILHPYPYGIYDTVWYRPLFKDEIDFHWVCDSNHVRNITMVQTDLENPDVLADFTYQPSTTNGSDDILLVYAWLERSGHVVLDPQKSTVVLYNKDGTIEQELTDTTAGPSGVFRMEWTNLTPPLVAGETYPAYVEIVHNGVTYDASIIYSIRLAGDAELDPILSAIQGLESSIINSVTQEVGELSDKTQAFWDDTAGRLTDLSDDTAKVSSNVVDLVDAMGAGGGSNTVMGMLEALTNDTAALWGPTTNTAAAVSNLNASTTTDDSRILNRPTTVLLGSTNTILYKTTANLSDVTISVEGTSVNDTSMAEVSVGIGIYEYDLIADWGIGSYVVSCGNDDNTDSIVLDVVAATSVGTIQEQVTGLESDITNVTQLVQSLSSDLPSIIGDIQNQLVSLEAAIGSGSETTDIQTLLQQSTQSLEVELSALVAQSTSAQQAATSAQAAKTAASDALAALQSMASEMATGNMDGVLGRLSDIESLVLSVNQTVQGLSGSLGISQLQTSMEIVASQITQLAAREGYDYEVSLEGGGAGGGGADEDAIGALNKNMGEVKSAMALLQKMIDAEQNAPFVQVDWIGVE